MKFEADTGAAGLPRITAYGPDHVVIAGVRHSENLVVFADRIITGWGPAAVAQLSALHLDALVQLEPEVVLLGTGTRLEFPPAAVMDYLPRRGIGLEYMDTGAACRAYNFLLGDERRVIAALLLG